MEFINISLSKARSGFLLMIVGFVFSGCATAPSHIEKGVNALNQRNYLEAYRIFEDPTPEAAERVDLIMKGNPQLVAAAASTFSQEALKASKLHYGGATALRIEGKRLIFYRKYASPADFETARLNFGSVFPDEIAAAKAEAEEQLRVSRLSPQEREEHLRKLRTAEIEKQTVRGIILSVQVVNESKAGSNAGSQLGRAIGSATYADSTSWRSYRATGHLAAALLGSVLGAQANTAPQAIFRKVYFVKTSEGKTVRLEDVGSDPIHYPIGQCLEYRPDTQYSLVESEKCSGR